MNLQANTNPQFMFLNPSQSQFSGSTLHQGSSRQLLHAPKATIGG